MPLEFKINAVVFDMDGLLLDSETLSLSTFIAACRVYGFDPDVKIYTRCIGTTYSQTQNILTDGYGKSFPFESIFKLWRQMFHNETWNKPIPLKEGAVSLLKYLDKGNSKKAVVTSSSRDDSLRRLINADILHYFDFVLCGDEITHSKPNPEIYLTACRKLNEEPVKCLALEDSNNGVLSAFQAGINVIQVPDMLEPSPEVRCLGHKIMKTLTEVEAYLKQLQLDHSFLHEL